jgi:uncharacterized membrane protein
MKYALLLFGLIFAIGLILTIIGMCTARDHETSLAQTYDAPVATLYALVRDYEKYPQWRSSVKSMTRDGEARYIEESANGKIPYKIIEETANTRLVASIDDPSLPFSGTWTYDITGRDGAAQLRITERGSVPNPLMRFFSTYVFSHEKTIRTYLDDVARRVAEK